MYQDYKSLTTQTFAVAEPEAKHQISEIQILSFQTDLKTSLFFILTHVKRKETATFTVVLLL